MADSSTLVYICTQITSFMQKSKSIRITNKAEKELRRFIKTSPKKVYKIQFASDAILSWIVLEMNLRTQENINND